MAAPVTIGRMVELVLAVILLGGGVWLYRRRTAEDRQHGSQGAVIMFAIAAILGIHALGLLEYHPSQSELDAASHGATAK